MQQMILISDKEWNTLCDKVCQKYGIKMIIYKEFDRFELADTLRDFINETENDIPLNYYIISSSAKLFLFTTCKLTEQDKHDISQFLDTDTFCNKDHNNYSYPSELIERINK
jgi:hypothetical protein